VRLLGWLVVDAVLSRGLQGGLFWVERLDTLSAVLPFIDITIDMSS